MNTNNSTTEGLKTARGFDVMLRLETDAHFRNFFVSMMVINAASSFLASVLNFLIILTFVKTTSLRTPSYILILSLAISDFGVAVVVQPVYFSVMFAQWTRNVPLWTISLNIATGLFFSYVCAVDEKCSLMDNQFEHRPEALKIYNGMSFDAPEDKDKLDAVIKKFDQYTIGETNETYERSAETTATQLKTITSAVNVTETVHIVNAKPYHKNRKPRNEKNDKNDDMKTKCRFCEGNHPQQKEKCPAWGQNCRKCSGRNHFARCCKKTRSQVHGVTQDDSESDPEYIGSVNTTDSVCAVDHSPHANQYPKEVYAEMLIRDKSVKFQVDCGASINILPKEFIGDHAVSPTTKTLIMWNKTEVKPLGTARITVKNPKTGKKFSIEFVVVSGSVTPLIGFPSRTTNETDKDETLQLLKDVILRGWPAERKDLPTQITPYFSVRDELVVQDGMIFRGERIVVPYSLRKEMKQRIHSSHLGAESCLRRARETLFWPGMSAEIKEMVSACETCRTYETSPQKETLMSHETPARPWEQIGVDLFTFDNKEFLVTVDYYSNFLGG
ncbi:hypothetical protein QZH41_000004 [Actinostola sp. cb2023]|nr:hypothetical protein QZH41_000004 [Actinostola sp. cb2023]